MKSTHIKHSRSKAMTSAGLRSALIADDQRMEKIGYFNRKRTPERVVHARNAGAFGDFKVTGDISRYTRAKLFQKMGNRCDVLVRFSTLVGEPGDASSVRDPRDFAVKFYTEEGHWDLLGHNTPLSFIRDPLKHPDFIQSQRRHPISGRRNPTLQWDFWSRSPESLHQLIWLFGDRAIPATLRHMNGYGVHTFSLWNAEGERYWVKWHLKTLQGIRCLPQAEATRIATGDPDYHRRDLWRAIERGDYPNWCVMVQILPEQAARSDAIDPFDLTKVWSHKDYPLIEVGTLVLNRNPRNHLLEVEQASFDSGNLPAGMGTSPDKMLQARLGVSPNAHGYPPGATDLGLRGTAHHYHRNDHEDYQQAGDLYRLMSAGAKHRLIENLIEALKNVPHHIQERQLGHFRQADGDFGQCIAEGLWRPRLGRRAA